jgi:hypothetical protein
MDGEWAEELEDGVWELISEHKNGLIFTFLLFCAIFNEDPFFQAPKRMAHLILSLCTIFYALAFSLDIALAATDTDK